MWADRRMRHVSALVVSGSVVALAACTGGSGAKAGATGTPIKGGVARVAEGASVYPTAIWPFDTPTQDTTVNIDTFQHQFYRPLYYWGLNDQVSEDPDVSVGQAPVWSDGGQTVTVTLKDWKWSDGTSVTGQDAVFWVNMARTEEGNHAGYTPPNAALGAKYFPDNVVSASWSGQSFTLHLDKAYNQAWYTDNQISQITPMPLAWDVTGPGAPGHCASDAFGSPQMKTDCAADWNYLSKQSTNGSTFATSPLWSVVDGPWRLKSYNATSGAYSIVPNTAYSGPQKPYLSEVDYIPYTSVAAEYADLRAGSKSPNALDAGYLPLQDAPVYNAANPNAGNPLAAEGYRIPKPAYLDSISFYQINFANPQVGPLFRQPYFTSAIQKTVDQQGIIRGISKGWGYPTQGVVPLEPGGNPISPRTSSEVATFDIAGAKSLLTKNGWDTSHTPAVCTNAGTGPGQCGAGIANGAKAAFTLDYGSGSASSDQLANLLASDAAQAGIQVTVVGQTENVIANESVPCTASQPAGCAWQGLLYGGWVYGIDPYPTGEDLFATGANIWGYSDPQLDSLIAQTATSNTVQSMYAYEDYIAGKQPVIFLPNGLNVRELVNNLHVDPGDPFQGTEPEYWYYD